MPWRFSIGWMQSVDEAGRFEMAVLPAVSISNASPAGDAGFFVSVSFLLWSVVVGVEGLS